MTKIKYYPAPDIKFRAEQIITALGLSYINPNRVFCFKSKGSKSKIVRARCYSFPRYLQKAFNLEPHYLIEVIGEFYDEMNEEDKDKLLIHELLHIPRTFSGSARNHKGAHHKGLVTKSVVNNYYKKLTNHNKSMFKRAKSKSSISFFPAPEIKSYINKIVNSLGLSYINPERIICFKINGSKARAPVMIGSLPIIWQQALNIEPHYIIEVVSKNFDNLTPEFKSKVLISRLMSIPKTFSGALYKKRPAVFLINKLYNKLISDEGLSWI